MADAAKQDQIEAFKNLTGVNEERAKFYLESAAWQLDVAVSNFYEGDDDGAEMDEEPSMPSEPSPPPQPLRTFTGASSGPSRSTGSKTKKSSRFATIGSMKQNEKSDSEEEGQAYYAGGSEESGEMILGPPKKKGSSHEFVEGLFKSAKDHGAKEVSLDEPSSRRGAPVFRGSGYRLGEEEGTSEVVAGPSGPTRQKEMDVTLTFWKDGFSLDDGPLRDFQDPANKPFLSSIQKGEIPDELLKLAKGSKVDVNMVDKHTEEFVQPKPKVHAFAGAGQMLGSPAPKVVTQAPGGPSSAPATKAVDVDSSQPVTRLQIRLSNGSRLVAELNHTHTVQDIRSHIINSHPEYAEQTFVLMTTFPNKELTDESQTLQEANLINAVVVQRLK
ncbi:NSFL1 cofactor p47-like isoform X2 [Lineus longissimus]|uniref:NSFL1 cofactor p47-like isoform X2 n=1 Tax=Lineus longissimus TaxID=88925 RepID=UPI00315DCB23